MAEPKQVTEFEFLKRVAFQRYPGKMLFLVINDIIGGFLVLIGLGGIVSFLVALLGSSGDAGLPKPLMDVFEFLGISNADTLTILTLLLIVFTLQTLVDGLREYVVSIVAIGFRKEIRKDLNEALLNADWISFMRADQGKYINNLIAESVSAGGAVRSLGGTIADGLMTVFFLFWILAFSLNTFLIALAAGALSLLISKPLLRLNRFTAKQKIIIQQKISNVVNDTRHLFKILIVENLVNKRVALLNVLIDDVAEAERENSRYSIIGSQYNKLFPVLVVIVVSYSYLRFQGGDGSQLIFDLLLLQQIVTRFSGFQSNRQNLINKIPSYESCLEVMEFFKPKTQDATARLPITSLDEGIRFEALTYSYPESEVGVANVSGSFPAKGLISIIGRSGSGKTTLVDILLGLIRPQSGQVIMDGKDLNLIDRASFSKIVAYLPQQAYLFQGTLRENLTFGREDVGDAEIYAALEAADCLDVVQELAEKLDAPVLPGGLNFSGGQRHRLALARALIRQAKILVLDEPSSSVDAVSERAILQTLKKMSKNMLVIVISHSQDVIQGTENLLLMHEGTCIWQGSYTEFVSDTQYAKLLSVE